MTVGPNAVFADGDAAEFGFHRPAVFRDNWFAVDKPLHSERRFAAQDARQAHRFASRGDYVGIPVAASPNARRR